MALPQVSAFPPGDTPEVIVLDTNLFYGNRTAIEQLARERGATVAVSLLSAMEIMCAENDDDLKRRQMAAENWLIFSDSVIPDNEIVHAEVLGYEADKGYVSYWLEAMKRFIKLQDVSKGEQIRVGLDLAAVISAKNNASSRFAEKTMAIIQTYRDRVQDAEEKRGEKIPFAVSHEEDLVGRIIGAFRSDVEQMHFQRIEETAKELGMAGDMVRDPSRISVYIDLYLEFVKLKVIEGPAHINDYFDLQFFSYCDAGYRFATMEDKWIELAMAIGRRDFVVAAKRIKSRPDIMGGDACIRDTRVPVWLMLYYRNQGLTESQILEQYPDLKPSDLLASWQYYSLHKEEVEQQGREHEEAS